LRFDLDALEALEAPLRTAGTPALIAIDLIDEDPAQPRREFAEELLREMAATIAERGVKQPISVRPHPETPGRWILNFGARRVRASKLAGKETIPAFIDPSVDEYDQVIENEQRDGLKPIELAAFVKKQMQAGVSQAEIARRLGKTRGYLTFVGALIDPPDWLLDAYRSGRCRGLTELYELRRLHAERPQAVAAWLGSRDKVSRADLMAFKEETKASNDAAPVQGLSKPESKAGCEPASTKHQPPAAARALTQPPSQRPLVLQARCPVGDVVIDLSVLPEKDGWVVVRPMGHDARTFPVLATDVQIVRVVPA
jgi:ParB family chromosome partitioning protein